MSMNVSQGDGDDDQAMSDINVTPLVDVMLVLLIIFLITIPVVRQMQPVNLPRISNIETQEKPENIILVITESGDFYDGNQKFESATLLKEFIKSRVLDAMRNNRERPEVHIRADKEVRFEAVGRAISAIQQAGIIKVGFLTEPQSHG